MLFPSTVDIHVTMLLTSFCPSISVWLRQPHKCTAYVWKNICWVCTHVYVWALSLSIYIVIYIIHITLCYCITQLMISNKHPGGCGSKYAVQLRCFQRCRCSAQASNWASSPPSPDGRRFFSHDWWVIQCGFCGFPVRHGHWKVANLHNQLSCLSSGRWSDPTWATGSYAFWWHSNHAEVGKVP